MFLLVAAGAYGSTVNCNNNSGDSALIQSALNSAGSGGTVTITGTCALGSATLVPAGPVIINGSALLNYSGGGDIVSYSGNSLVVNGLTFQGGGIHGTSSHYQGAWSITNCKFQNISRTALNYAAIFIDHILAGPPNTPGPNTISNNTFKNIWQGGYSSQNCGQECIAGSGIWFNGGLDQITIDSNVLDEIGYDGIKGFFDNQYGTSPGWALTSHNIVISNNVMTNVHRIGIEFQGIGYSGCPGGCNYNQNPSDGTTVSGNFWHAPAFLNNPFAYSILFGGTNAKYINNTGVVDSGTPCYYRPGIGIEDGDLGGLNIGNVIGSVSTCGGVGWAAYVSDVNYFGGTDTYQNNVFCGAGNPNVQQDSTANKATIVSRYNFSNTTCPNASSLATSSIAPVFTSANNQSFPSGGNGTWSVSVVSNLSIRNVQFFVDSSTSPVVTQVIQDVNTNFANDRKWLYHATINTAGLGGGSHTITAKATDVSGGTQSIAQTFSAGYVGAPIAQVNPTSLSFGSQTVGVITPAKAITLSNTGSGPLTVNGVSITGANSSVFVQSSNCGSSVAGGASCTISVTFAPSAAGSSIGTLSISDNVSGSPQTVSLSGTGTTPSSGSGGGSGNTLPKNLPTGMLLWLANDAGLVTNGGAVSSWDDQSGNGNNAVQSNQANSPVVVDGNNGQQALRFDGASAFMSIPSLPIDGLTGLSVFTVSANSKDLPALSGLYALLFWDETGPWGRTFFGSYQSSLHFRFGTMQTGNDPVYQIPFNRTNSFGLSEWMHSGTTDSMWLNGQSVASYTGAASSIAGVANTAYLGQGLNKTFYAGDVSEIIIYSRGLSTSERQIIEQYLMSKYHL
jgi:hypothetical protein